MGTNGHGVLAAQAQADTPKVGVTVTVALDGVSVVFPPDFWAEPSHNLLAADGSRLWQTRVNQILQTLGGALVTHLEKRGVLQEDGSLRPPLPAVLTGETVPET